jgi:parvulin-like peptidyl-prolyl isomerase
MIRKWIAPVLMAMLVCGAAEAEVIDRIVAVVNDDIITLSELNNAFSGYIRTVDSGYQGADREAYLRQAREAFLQQMINQMLIEQEAKKAGTGMAAIKDDEVMEVIREMLAKNKMTLEDYTRKLAAEGHSLDSAKKEIKTQMLRMRLLRREVQSKIIVTNEEIGDYYDKHRQDYEGKEAARLKQIFLPAPADGPAAEREKARSLAKQLRDRLVQGEPFDAIAAKYSKGPAASQGGDIGFVEKGVILPAVEKEAFSLNIGQLSDVIETEAGYHIILVTDKRGAGLKPIAAVRDEIKAKIEDEKISKKYEEWITDLRKKAFIDVRL